MTNLFTYQKENEQGWLVEKVSAKEKEYFENWIPKRFKYDYPDPKKEMELGKDFEVYKSRANYKCPRCKHTFRQKKEHGCMNGFVEENEVNWIELIEQAIPIEPKPITQRTYTKQKFFAVEYSGYWNIQDAPHYGASNLLDADDVGEETAKSNAELIANLLNKHYE